ncbi:MAG: hypothetical protein OXC62_00440 [Aestuariivita sp.]|nr:hypothetical protein [Aestuariivita sp.]
MVPSGRSRWAPKQSRAGSDPVHQWADRERPWQPRRPTHGGRDRCESRVTVSEEYQHSGYRHPPSRSGHNRPVIPANSDE